MRIGVRGLAALLVMVPLCWAAGAAEEVVTVRPTDTGEALVNPDMGWTMHFYSNIIANYGSKLAPSDTLDDFPGVSTVYLRMPWAFLEPEEGKFNWSLVDSPGQRWVSRGKKMAFRVTCSENWMRYATPKWVEDAGAKGYDYQFGKGRVEGGPWWDPDYLDPIYLEKLDAFLAAMAARYDGSPNVAFVDVGTYGLWGEGHTLMSSQCPEEDLFTIQKTHIDLHLKHFKKTLLAISDDFAGHDKPGRHFPITDYALSKGVTIRDDSIMVQPPPKSWYHAEMAQEFWPTLPIILEHQHYGTSKEWGAWGEDGSLLLKAVEEYHASYMSIHWWPRILLNENRALIDKINLRMGYRLQLREATWPKQVPLGAPFVFKSAWANAGVAPCYPGGFMAVTIKDDKGGFVSVHVDESFTMADLKTGAPGKAPVKELADTFAVAPEFIDGPRVFARAAAPGTYGVYVSVGMRDGTPVIALPLPEDDGQRRYRLGTIEITPRRPRK